MTDAAVLTDDLTVRDTTSDAPTRTPRVALFTHDAHGLGHLSRCRHLVRALAERRPEAAVFFITGSPAMHLFGELPPHADLLKVPTVGTGSTRHQPPHLPIATAGLQHLRQRLIQEAVVEFGPDVFLVDDVPLGSQGELLPTLLDLRRTRTRLVLGLRDILDWPDVVRRDWRRQGIYDVLDRYYDRILVYGMREVFDVARVYQLPLSVAEKITYCGYLTGQTRPAPPDETARVLGVSGPFILATCGGGSDGYPLLRAFVDAMTRFPDRQAVAVTGPQMSPADRARLREAAGGHVVVHDYVPDLARHLGGADLVIAMAGYGNATEIVASGARALLVPRHQDDSGHALGATPGEAGEQLIRAQALARLGAVDTVDPSGLTPDRLAGRMAELLEDDRVDPLLHLDLTGLSRATTEVVSLLDATTATP